MVIEQKLFKFVCPKCKSEVVLPLKDEFSNDSENLPVCTKCNIKMKKIDISFVDKLVLRNLK